MSTSTGPYHHGDLRAACLRAAMELLEEGGATALSLRAVARKAGVSAAAPYRHYANRGSHCQFHRGTVNFKASALCSV